MTTRELIKKLQALPEEYMDDLVIVYDADSEDGGLANGVRVEQMMTIEEEEDSDIPEDALVQGPAYYKGTHPFGDREDGRFPAPEYRDVPVNKRRAVVIKSGWE